MNHSILFALMLVAFAATTAPVSLVAQVRDSVEVIESPGGGSYRCCLSMNVLSRQTRPTTIGEFHLRILSGRATFIPGSAGSPTDWTVFLASDLKSVAWYASTTASEMDSGRSKSGFLICVADTGIVRLVWETRNIDSLFSRDTIEVACRGVDCDEAFFRRVPSAELCLFDIDLVGGNRRDLAVNDFRLHMLTPGVSFSTAAFTQPAGWVRNRISSDSIQFFTNTRSLRFGEFVEGFRFLVSNPADTFRVLYRTFNNGDLLCTDTATLVCTPLEAIDSIRVRRSQGCCNDITLTNAHRPTSQVDRFVVRVVTPGVRMSSTPNAPAGWTRGAVPAAGDSVFYTRAVPMASGDTALFSGLCFENAQATSDTIRYAWKTYSAGIPVSGATEMQLCLRPLTRCDSARAIIDSTEGVATRCISLFVKNLNSRNEGITRVVARISNPGTARRIMTATAPAGWQVAQLGRDSVAFTGTFFESGDEVKFEFCVSTGDSTMRDPILVTWRTESARGELCAGSLRVFGNIVRSSDSASVFEVTAQNPEMCCYSISFANRNDANRALTGFQLEVVTTDVLFADATAPGPWNVVSSGFPSPQIGYAGGSVAPGDSTPRFTFCIDARNIPGRPATIPIIWRSFSDATPVTTERLDLPCVGSTSQQCDTASLSSTVSGEATCTYSFGVANLHSPASSITKVQFVITSADGTFSNAFATGEAARWTQITLRPDSVVFRGDSIATGTTVGNFNLEVRQDLVSTTFEVTTYNGDESICRDVISGTCAVGGIALPATPTGFRLGDAAPNPFSHLSTVAYELLRPASVTMLLRDERGELIRRFDIGDKSVGEHSFVIDASALASGTYMYTLEAGGERWTKRMVVVR